MKNLIMFLGLTLAVSTLSAQTEIKPTIGINFANVSGDPENGTVKGTAGWQIGGSVEFGNKVYGEIGVLYVKESSEFTSTSPDYEDLDFNQKGFRIPVNIGWNILGSMESDFNIHAIGGGSAYFLTGSDGLDKDDLEGTQWGVFAGAGVDLWIFFIDLTYEWSLTDVETVTEFNLGKTHAFFANAGVRFRL